MYLSWLSRLFPPVSLLAHVIVQFLTIRPFNYHIYIEKTIIDISYMDGLSTCNNLCFTFF